MVLYRIEIIPLPNATLPKFHPQNLQVFDLRYPDGKKLMVARKTVKLK